MALKVIVYRCDGDVVPDVKKEKTLRKGRCLPARRWHRCPYRLESQFTIHRGRRY